MTIVEPIENTYGALAAHTPPPEPTMDRFIVMTASARMPSSYRGAYRRVAVVETSGVTEPKMISERARGCVRVVETWERCSVGTGSFRGSSGVGTTSPQGRSGVSPRAESFLP